MPGIVAHGREPDVMACGFCHLPTGNGRPENAALAGLPRDYIIAQLRHFRDGSRRSSVPGRAPTELMISVAKAASDAEIAAAADYFSSLEPQSFVRVVESGTIPKSRVAGWVYARDPSGGTDPLGARIVEMPEDFDQFERRNPATAYIAYAPPGSIARGEALAQNWRNGEFACSHCHGANLDGQGAIPRLAGRSPTFLFRQLEDFKTGARRGPDAEPMTRVVDRMDSETMIDLAAYLASRKP
jgi:cytochrome c553